MNRTEWLASLGPDVAEPEQVHRLREAQRLRDAGRVLSLRTQPGRIEARVQGSHARPHMVELNVAAWTDEQWGTVGQLLARQARHYARLLAGQLPDQFGLALAELGLSLIPRAGEWQLRCTCGDARVPCVHQVAVWLAVRDRLAAEPYVLTRLRGRGREQLLAELRDHRSSGAPTGVKVRVLDVERWSRGQLDPSEVPLPPLRQPAMVVGALRMLGDPPGWAGPADAATMLGPAIAEAAARARRLLAGGEVPRATSTPEPVAEPASRDDD